MLHPGGCAEYQFSLKPDQTWIFVLPARKVQQGKDYEDYCNKGMISVTSSHTKLTCFEDPTDCSARSCVGKVDLAIDLNSKEEKVVHFSVCNDHSSLNDAAIWEINFSSSNDSNKLQAYFESDAKLRFRSTTKISAFDTQLSLVNTTKAYRNRKLLIFPKETKDF